MPRQYLAVRFKHGQRPYTYHNDGQPLRPGHTARVQSRDGLGWQNVDVIEVDLPRPHFDTKPIIAPDWIDAMTPEECRTLLANPAEVAKHRPAADLFDSAQVPDAGAPLSPPEHERIKAKSMKARV